MLYQGDQEEHGKRKKNFNRKEKEGKYVQIHKYVR